MVAAKPRVGLLSGRGVESPLLAPLLCLLHQLRKARGQAPVATELICFLMALRMPGFYDHSRLVKVSVSLFQRWCSNEQLLS